MLMDECATGLLGSFWHDRVLDRVRQERGLAEMAALSKQRMNRTDTALWLKPQS